MMKIYTPKEWSRAFGGVASLNIDDNGYIYDANRSGIGSSPIGRIEYDRNEIYGSDYGSFIRTPIAYIVRSRNHLEVVANDGTYTKNVILYIMDDKIYTPQEWGKTLTGTPSGHIETNGKGKTEKIVKGAAEASAASGWGVILLIILLFSGGISKFIVTSPELFIVVVVGIIVLCCRKGKNKGSAKSAK